MTILNFKIDDTLQLFDNDLNYVGFINKLYPEVSFDPDLDVTDISTVEVLKKIQGLLSTGYYSVFVNYKNYMSNGEKIWGFHHLCLCLYLHENFEPFGAYTWDHSFIPNVTMHFWTLMHTNSYMLQSIGLSYTSNTEHKEMPQVNVDIEMSWEELTVHNPNFNFPFYRNLFYLSCLSKYDNTNYQNYSKLLSLNYSIDHLLDQLLLNLPVFLDLLDDYLHDMSLNEYSYSLIDSTSSVMFNELNEEDLKNFDFSFASDFNNQVNLSDNLVNSEDENTIRTDKNRDSGYLSFLSNQNIKDEITPEQVRDLIKQFFYNYSKTSFSIHNKSIPSGFLVDFIDYLNRSLDLIFKKAESLKVNYLRLQFIYNTAHTLSSMYFYKYIVDNYFSIFIAQEVSDQFKKEISIKIRSISIFIKNRISKLNDILVHDPLFVNVYSIIFFYLDSFSQFLNYIKCTGSEIDLNVLNEIYNNELEYIDNLDYNFFVYLTRRLPRQVYRLP